MTAARDRRHLVEDLRRAMDELCAPELTLARAGILRPRVDRILEALRDSEPPSRRGEGHPPGTSGRGMGEG